MAITYLAFDVGVSSKNPISTYDMIFIDCDFSQLTIKLTVNAITKNQHTKNIAFFIIAPHFYLDPAIGEATTI